MVAGMAIAGAGTLPLVVQPPPGIYWLHSSDLFWLAGLLCLLVGSIESYRHEVEQAATQREAADRAHLAGQLHDGMAQDLAFVASHCRYLANRQSMTPEDLHLVADASSRALGHSRLTIQALRSGRPEDPSEGAE
jgi:signal transduction histidine kinase